MADRNFYRKQSIQREVKEIFAKVSIGASGAPTLASNEVSQGVTSIVRNSAGNYTLTLDDKYYAFLSADISFLYASAMGLVPQIIAEDVDGAKTIQFVCQSVDSAASIVGDQELSSIQCVADDAGLADAIVSAESLRVNMNAHAASATTHLAADSTNFPLTSPTATDLASLIALVTEQLVDFDAHEADDDAGAGSYHDAAEASDATLASTTAPTTLAECIVDIADMKAKFNIHDADSTSHASNSSEHQDATAAPAGSLNSQYFTFSSTTDDYYVWFNVATAGSDPAPGGTEIEIALSLGDSAETIAAAVAAAISLKTGLSAFSSEEDKVIIVSQLPGDVTDIDAGNTGWTVVVLDDGVDAVSAVSAAAATDPTSGSIIYIKLNLKNSKFRGE